MRIQMVTSACTYGDGPFHPAIHNNGKVMYWLNVTFPTQNEAYQFAAKALGDAYQAAADIAGEWYLYKAMANLP